MLTSTESISISSGAPTPNLLSNLPGAGKSSKNRDVRNGCGGYETCT
jgi:hypothetical protein